jgi:hypothetical protein
MENGPMRHWISLILLGLSVLLVAGCRGRIVTSDDYTLESGNTLRGGLTVFSGDVTLEEGSHVTGNVYMTSGNLVANGEIDGDIFLTSGNVELGSEAVVHGHILTTSGDIRRAEGSRVATDPEPVLESRSVQIGVEVVSAGAALVNLLPDRNNAELPGTSERSTQVNACGSVDGIVLPCWKEYLSDGEGNESLPDYPFAKRPNGCSVPGAIPGANDTITLFFIEIGFTDICNAHDRCYYTLGTTPRECNEPFKSGLRARCDDVIAAHVEGGWDIVTRGISIATALEACHTKADAMAMGVIAAQQMSHAQAQINQQKYLTRVEAYVKQARTKVESD